jgi:hypothetical protein
MALRRASDLSANRRSSRTVRVGVVDAQHDVAAAAVVRLSLYYHQRTLAQHHLDPVVRDPDPHLEAERFG